MSFYIGQAVDIPKYKTIGIVLGYRDGGFYKVRIRYIDTTIETWIPEEKMEEI